MKSIMEATTILLGTQLIPLFLFSLSALACSCSDMQDGEQPGVSQVCLHQFHAIPRHAEVR